jgi:hypothetical protein
MKGFAEGKEMQRAATVGDFTASIQSLALVDNIARTPARCVQCHSGSSPFASGIADLPQKSGVRTDFLEPLRLYRLYICHNGMVQSLPSLPRRRPQALRHKLSSRNGQSTPCSSSNTARTQIAVDSASARSLQPLPRLRSRPLSRSALLPVDKHIVGCHGTFRSHLVNPVTVQ